MTEDTKDNLAALDVGQQAIAELPLTEELLHKLDKATETHIFTLLTRGETLEPAFAVQAWIEKYTHRLLLRRLTQRVLMGQTASEDLAPDMEKD